MRATAAEGPRFLKWRLEAALGQPVVPSHRLAHVGRDVGAGPVDGDLEDEHEVLEGDEESDALRHFVELEGVKEGGGEGEDEQVGDDPKVGEGVDDAAPRADAVGEAGLDAARAFEHLCGVEADLEEVVGKGEERAWFG